ncbi:hypothetical protein GOP47_0030596, partial [Adiantum capillus-veneris]
MVALNLLDAAAATIQPKQDELHTHEKEKNLQRHSPKPRPILAEPSKSPVVSLCNHGLLDQAVHALSLYDPSSSSVSRSTYMALLKACNRKKSLLHAKQVRSHLDEHHVCLEGSLGDYLVVTLAKCGGLRDACLIHHGLSLRTVYSWTAIITAFVDCGHSEEALRLYHRMREDGVEPDDFTFVSLFRACGNILDLGQGRKLHDEARSKGYHMDLF